MSRLATDVLIPETGSALNGSLAWHQYSRHRSGPTRVTAKQPSSHIISSGMSALDDLLPDGGWRNGAITEILSDINDDSGLNLVLPALATVSREKKWLVWVSPPQFLDRFKLANAGIDISRVLLVHPRVTTNGLWLVEQVLRAGTCSAVLTWMTGGDASNTINNNPLNNADILGRLQLAAEVGETLGFIFRDSCDLGQNSPVTTRLLLKKQQQKIQLEILKDSNKKLAEPRVLKFSANRLNRQNHNNRNNCNKNYHHQGPGSQNPGNQNPRPKNQQLSLY